MTPSEILQLVVAIASTGLAWFCIVLARRLRRLNDLEVGLGGAIAVMAAEIERLEKAIRLARDEAMTAGKALSVEIDKAQKERAAWELHKKIGNAASDAARPVAARRLRKRMEHGNA